MAVHFSVDTKLTRLLGETYRSSEVALKELVDNAWDADARNVVIVLPDPLSSESIIVQDDGTGMTALELRGEYLNIASDKRSRIGKETPGLRRKVKGRKGIGKFAGLMIAEIMQVESTARGRKCTLLIDKKELIDSGGDLETVPLSFEEAPAEPGVVGTKIVLSLLNANLNFPTADRLREVLIHEYGREDDFKVTVNGVSLSVQDVPGTPAQSSAVLPAAGNVDLRFTIADGKKLPRSPGIILKVGGKAVGKPQLFGLDDDEQIPQKLVRKVYGEVEITGMEEFVTADWGGVIENSKAYQEAQQFIQSAVKKQLEETYTREMSLQKARLQRQIDARIQKLPENRRHFAEQAVHRILKRFYGETVERVETIVEVALDAMEHDAYWEVLERISEARHADVASFAEALEQFGILELSTIAIHAAHRRTFLDFLDQLVENVATLEKDVHKAFENNLWILGRKYSLLSSNTTLRSVIATYCDSEFTGNRASKRPDLLLSQDYGDSYLLIEFKRPSYPITRDDVAQAEKYRDDLSPRLSSTSKMEIVLIGKGRALALDANRLHETIAIQSYASIISSARTELDWLIASLASPHVGMSQVR
ncbi:ATP-binding protein [Bradyrhizobium sp. Ai1a-2]|uniref:ATP-binding protein n=1 Tax=Bradyrhizobium sp. Ai1a-2 TaxID=196490 RepID=UPI00041DC240|nr:ATP-binding protein [Bradyrhizobium sp. Ai1a-2]